MNLGFSSHQAVMGCPTRSSAALHGAVLTNAADTTVMQRGLAVETSNTNREKTL